MLNTRSLGTESGDCSVLATIVIMVAQSERQRVSDCLCVFLLIDVYQQAKPVRYYRLAPISTKRYLQSCKKRSGLNYFFLFLQEDYKYETFLFADCDGNSRR